MNFNLLMAYFAIAAVACTLCDWHQTRVARRLAKMLIRGIPYTEADLLNACGNWSTLSARTLLGRWRRDGYIVLDVEHQPYPVFYLQWEGALMLGRYYRAPNYLDQACRIADQMLLNGAPASDLNRLKLDLTPEELHALGPSIDTLAHCAS